LSGEINATATIALRQWDISSLREVTTMTDVLAERELMLRRWAKAAGISAVTDPNEVSAPYFDAITTLPNKVLLRTLEDIVRRAPGNAPGG
jgi:hypothetical protein